MLLWAALVIITIWMLLRYVPAGLDARYPLTQIIALIPLLAVPLLIVGIAAIATHQRAQIIVTLVLLGIHLLWSLTFFVPMPAIVTTILGSPRQTWETTYTDATENAQSSDSNSADSQGSPKLTVMTINSLWGRADTSVIMHTIKLHHVDVLAVQEVSDDFVSRLHNDGILQELGFEQLGEKTSHDNAGFNALWSRYPVSQAGGSLLEDMGSNTPWMRITVDGREVRLVSTHPYSPHRSTEQWHADISRLTQLIGDGTARTDVPTIVMGDLNSSTFHGTFRSVVNAGLLDSSLELHHGAHTTFPSSWMLVPPMIEIDHVLHTRELTATSMSAVQIPRTDHRGLIATIEWK